MERAPGLAPSPQKSIREYIPLFLCVAIFSIVIVYFSLSVPAFRRKADSVSLDANRYIKMEWSLLQELKVRTDQQLREKDREITQLRENYRKALSGEASAASLKGLEAKLKEAEAERRKILAASTSVPPAPVSAEGAPAVDASAASASLGSPALDVLLLARIDEQEASLAELKSRNAEAERELAALKGGLAASAVPAAEDLSAKYSRGLGEALASMQSKKTEAERAEGVGIDDLNAWALLRALANTASVKEKYPELLPAVEKYVAAFGERRFSEGRSEAYAESIKALEALVRGLK